MTNTPEHDKRERIEVNRYIERGFTHAEIIEIVREVFDTGNVPSWIWNHPGMADVINTQLTLLRARATRNDPANSRRWEGAKKVWEIEAAEAGDG